MNNTIIEHLRTLNVINEDKLIEYVVFCTQNHDDDGDANHHILPKVIFPNFSNFNKNRWNLSRLSYKNHYIAHFLFCLAIDNYSQNSAFIAMSNKDVKNGRISKDDLIDPDIFQTIMERRDVVTSMRNKGKVLAKDLITNKIKKVSKEEFDADKNLVGHTKGGGGEHLKGTISVLNEDGITIRIPKDEYDPKIHVGHTKGKTTYKDKHGNTYQCSKDDSKVLSGELVGINKGRKFNNTSSKGQQVTIHIYNENHELMFECYGNFKKTCYENNLPIKQLSATIKSGIPIQNNTKKFKNKGWYAMKFNKSNL